MKKIIALAMAILIAAISIPLSLASDIRGDVNGDNKVNSSDALMILQYVVGLYKGEISLQNGDLNSDKQINSADALWVLQICVGLIETTSRETTITTTTESTTWYDDDDDYTLTSSKTTVEYDDDDYDYGGDYGDDNGEYPLEYKLKYKVGDKLEGTFKTKYMIRLYSNGNTSFIPSGEIVTNQKGKSNNKDSDVSYVETTTTHYPVTTTTHRPETTTTHHPETTTTTITKVEDYFLYLDSVDASISNIVETIVPHMYYDDDYNVIKKDKKKYTNYISFTFKGHTDKALSGKRITFDDPPYYKSWHYGFSFESISDNMIKKDGSFEFTVVYKEEGNINYSILGRSFSVKDLDIFDTEYEWEHFLEHRFDW